MKLLKLANSPKGTVCFNKYTGLPVKFKKKYMNITDFIGGGWKEMMDNNIQKKGFDVSYFEPMVFNSEEEALEYFEKYTTCMSDDVDAEEARFERWVDDNRITINELE